MCDSIICTQITLSMNSKSLNSIDEQLIGAGEFLSMIEKDDHFKMQCLEVFSNSINIVEWIRKETKGN